MHARDTSTVIAVLTSERDQARARLADIESAARVLVDNHGADDEHILSTRPDWYAFRVALDSTFTPPSVTPCDFCQDAEANRAGLARWCTCGRRTPAPSASASNASPKPMAQHSDGEA